MRSVLIPLIVFISISSWASEKRQATGQRMVAIGSALLQIDPKVWSYYPPGILRSSDLLPFARDKGLLIKFIDQKNKRITFIVRESGLTTTAKEECHQIETAGAARSISSAKNSCTEVINRNGKNSTATLVFSDFKNFRLYSISVEFPVAQEKEVLKDLEWIRTAMESS